MLRVLTCFMLLLPIAAGAQQFNILATVNGQPISNYDVYERTKVIISSSDLPNTPEVQEELAPQMLQNLIDETLRKQAAEKEKITLSEREINQALSDIEKKNSLKPGGFADFVRGKGANPSAVIEQIEAQLLWQKLIALRIKPHVSLSDYEVKDAMEWIAKQNASPEVYLHVMVLDINDDKPNESKALAKRLVKELRDGKSFSTLAKNFSSSGTDGTVGWVPIDRLDPSIRNVVSALKKHQVAEPIIEQDAIRIIKIGNKRSADEGSFSKEKVEQLLLLRKQELAIQRYVKDLRQNAFIDKRI